MIYLYWKSNTKHSFYPESDILFKLLDLQGILYGVVTKQNIRYVSYCYAGAMSEKIETRTIKEAMALMEQSVIDISAEYSDDKVKILSEDEANKFLLLK